MTQPTQITFISRIKALDLVSFKVEEKKQDLTIDSSKVTFEIGVDVSVNETEKTVTISNPINIFSDETKKHFLGSIQTKGEFIIENFQEIKVENGVPGPIVASFVGVTISTARGMLRILSKGTDFESAIIPIVNPTAMLQSGLRNFGPSKI